MAVALKGLLRRQGKQCHGRKGYGTRLWPQGIRAYCAVNLGLWSAHQKGETDAHHDWPKGMPFSRGRDFSLTGQISPSVPCFETVQKHGQRVQNISTTTKRPVIPRRRRGHVEGTSKSVGVMLKTGPNGARSYWRGPTDGMPRPQYPQFLLQRVMSFPDAEGLEAEGV